MNSRKPSASALRLPGGEKTPPSSIPACMPLNISGYPPIARTTTSRVGSRDHLRNRVLRVKSERLPSPVTPKVLPLRSFGSLRVARVINEKTKVLYEVSIRTVSLAQLRFAATSAFPPHRLIGNCPDKRAAMERGPPPI